MGMPLGRHHILLIEDEPAIADTVVYALESEGFRVSACTTGGAGLEVAEARPVDLVVLDIGLPDASGFDIYRRLQAAGPVPVIFLTARTGEIDRVAGLEMGADDYVVKPFSPRELTARVRAVLRRSRAPRVAAAAPADPFEVDEERLAVRYHGSPLELSRYEYRLLMTLLDSPGRVLSRRQLMDRGWENPDHAMERTVDTHIKTLRAKLKAVCPQEDPIETRRGLGYALRLEQHPGPRLKYSRIIR